MNPSLVPLPVKIVPAPDLIRRYTALEGPERRHLESLMAFWSLLADFSFSDLLLFAPVTGDRGEGDQAQGEPGSSEAFGPERPGEFVVLGQIRPTTSQTLYEVDLVGQVQSAESLPEPGRGLSVRRDRPRQSSRASPPTRSCASPTSPWATAARSSECSAASGRHGPPGGRGTLERVYLDLFERLSVMVRDGLFPFVADDAAVEEAPRVGDGVIVVDAFERITYASPNAVNALHRASITSSIVGSSLVLLGLETSVLNDAFSSKLPAIEEVERPPDVILMIRCIPLIARGELTGAALLLRDVTDLRRRDRLLLTKDATIREVHHRVKNNLQTISSLLRLQARRLDEAEVVGRIALLEAERRIRAIALVHDILARDVTEQVPFEEIVSALVNMIRETSTISFPVTIEVDGGLGDVAAEVATPLAVAIAELLQNAVEHAFPEPLYAGGSQTWAPGPGPLTPSQVAGDLQTASVLDARVDLVLDERPDALGVVVRDNGCGLPAGFDIDRTRSLGLSIVRDLVRSQLGGTISMETDGGTVVSLEIPVSRRAS